MGERRLDRLTVEDVLPDRVLSGCRGTSRRRRPSAHSARRSSRYRSASSSSAFCVHATARPASGLNSATSTAPMTTRSWFPTRLMSSPVAHQAAALVWPRRHTPTSRRSTRSRPASRFTTSSSTASRACRFAWMSEMTAARRCASRRSLLIGAVVLAAAVCWVVGAVLLWRTEVPRPLAARAGPRATTSRRPRLDETADYERFLYVDSGGVGRRRRSSRCAVLTKRAPRWAGSSESAGSAAAS